MAEQLELCSSVMSRNRFCLRSNWAGTPSHLAHWKGCTIAKKQSLALQGARRPAPPKS